MIVVLDSGPLGLLALRPGVEEGDRCRDWLRSIEAGGASILIPGIADYEVRRELVRNRAVSRVRALDYLRERLEYVAIDMDVLDRAAHLWAEARSKGKGTAGRKAIDADVIVAAVAILEGPDTVVATTNVKHLSRYCEARTWQEIGQ